MVAQTGVVKFGRCLPRFPGQFCTLINRRELHQGGDDLASDRTSDHTFLANHLRLFYSCAAYVLIHSLRDNTLAHTELARAQPMTIILRLFKLAVRVVQYKDRIKLSLSSACPVKGVLARVTEILYLVPRPPTPA